MKYRLDFSEKFSLYSPPATGYGGQPPTPFYAWQPSTWPAPPATVDEEFVIALKRIFEESILGEIDKVIADAHGNLEHRGHVVVIALMCALDAISSYGYGAQSGRQIPDFVRAHFPTDYHRHANEIRELYRNAVVHSWNLFKVSLYPGHEGITRSNGVLSLGILNFHSALIQATEDFLENLFSSKTLQENSLARYTDLRGTAVP